MMRWPQGTAAHDDDAAELTAAVDSLRALLRAERHRLRPDSHRLVHALTERAAEYAPAWARLRELRPAETAELPLLLTRRLEPLLGDFLALPDSEKPAHADELHARLQELEAECRRITGRLTRALTAHLRARLEP